MQRFLRISASVGILLSGGQLALAQVPQGQVLYNCPPGYICTPQAQPQNLPPRQLTAEDLLKIREGMVNDTAGAILSPREIGQLRDRSLDAQGAATWPGYSGDALPAAEPRTITIDDATRRAPERITLALGVVTPVTFLDRKGKPWPIAGVAYDARTFAQDGVGCGSAAPQASATGEARPSTITLMPCRMQTFGNVSVSLEGLSAPIVLLAVSGDRSGRVDLPVTVRVTGSGPQTAAQEQLDDAERRARALKRAYSAAQATPKGTDPELDAFASGVPPKGAEAVRTDLPGTTAWLYGGRLYLAGPVTVINPEFDAMGVAAGGRFVWRFAAPVARVRVVLDDGSERSVTIRL